MLNIISIEFSIVKQGRFFKFSLVINIKSNEKQFSFLQSNRNALPRILALTKAQDEKVNFNQTIYNPNYSSLLLLNMKICRPDSCLVSSCSNILSFGCTV